MMNWLKRSVYNFYILAIMTTLPSYAQNVTPNSNVPSPNLSGSQTQTDFSIYPQSSNSKKQENITVRGHREPPPGYSYAPSMNLDKGPDPDHQRGLAESKDPVSGANLSKYGTAYRESGPMGSGKVGDSTGNGWLIPR